MTSSELKEYLSALVEMEKEVYLQKQLLLERKAKISKLAIPTYYKKPVLIKPIQKTSSNDIPAILVGLWIGVKYGAISGAIIAFIACGLLRASFSDIFAGAGIGILGVGIVASIYLGLSNNNEREQSLQEYNTELKRRSDEYDIATTKYKQAVKADAARVQEEQKVQYFLSQEYNVIQSELQRSKNILESLYAQNVVFPKYQNFVMISSIYEYIFTERVKTLGDAYNILESEMRLDRITAQLDSIISHLADIKNNQYIIYNAIQEANEALSQINDSSQRIESEIRMFQEQGEKLHAQIAGLQITSGLNLYYNRLNSQQNAYLRRWVMNRS